MGHLATRGGGRSSSGDLTTSSVISGSGWGRWRGAPAPTVLLPVRAGGWWRRASVVALTTTVARVSWRRAISVVAGTARPRLLLGLSSVLRVSVRRSSWHVVGADHTVIRAPYVGTAGVMLVLLPLLFLMNLWTIRTIGPLSLSFLFLFLLFFVFFLP